MDGLTAASSGMLADERLQQVITNNISNLSTPGFKQSSGQLMSFPEQLVERYLAGSNGTGSQALGAVNNGVLFQESVGDFSQGILKQTGQPLDLAIQDPVTQGTAVYAQTAAGAQTVSTLSFVIGKGGVVETAQGDPILPVDATGQPISGARVVVNPAFKGLDLFGEDGSPVVDTAGRPSYNIIGADGKQLADTGSQAAATLRMTNSSTGGNRSFFPVENVDAQGRVRVALTRDGQFQVGSDHFLYNSAGQRVLATGANGQPILNSAIRVNPAYTGTDYFGKDGIPLKDGAGNLSYTTVGVNGSPLAGAHFGAVTANGNTLQPLGSTAFLLTPQTQLQTSNATIVPGSLESSNADDTQNMVDLIAVYRSYEANQKVVQTLGTALQSTVSQVGAVAGL